MFVLKPGSPSPVKVEEPVPTTREMMPFEATQLHREVVHAGLPLNLLPSRAFCRGLPSGRRLVRRGAFVVLSVVLRHYVAG